MSTVDPLGSFVPHFEDHGVPPPGWVDLWGEGGDPLRRAWAISVLPRCLTKLLHLVQHPAFPRAQDAWRRSSNEPGHRYIGRGEDEGECRRCADAIRAVVPDPPTLEQALDTTRGEGARRAWDASERGDELLRLAVRGGVDPRVAVLAACDCLRLCEPFFSELSEQSLEAFEIIEGCARRGATQDDTRQALKLARRGEHETKALGLSAGQNGRAVAKVIASGIETLATMVYSAGEHGELTVIHLEGIVEAVTTAFVVATKTADYVYDPGAPEERAALSACARVVRARIPAFPGAGNPAT